MAMVIAFTAVILAEVAAAGGLVVGTESTTIPGLVLTFIRDARMFGARLLPAHPIAS